MGKGYWKEYDENGKLIRVCQKDDLGHYNGYCYYYNYNGNLDKLSYWKNESENAITGSFKLFDVYHNLWFEGNFVNGYREGRGKEEKNMIEMEN